MYQKEIIYMSLIKNGSRVGSAGFLKVEHKNAQCRFLLKLQNIPYAINGRFPIRIYNGADWNEVDGVTVKDGHGVWEENAGDADEKIRLQILLPEGYLVEGQSSKISQNLTAAQTESEPEAQAQIRTEPKPEMQAQIRTESKPEAQAQARMESKLEMQAQIRTESKPEAQAQARIESKPEAQAQIQMESKPEVQEQIRTAAMHERREPLMTEVSEMEASQPGTVKEDKWEQILSSYEQIHPYGDERVYVKIEPKDFIILQSKYQHLVNNSFLLHGFYNYRYIILGKEDDYYLGVPGVFYKREKMVALMFGFEAFECENGIAEEGKFGYYLRKVEL